MGSIDKTDMLLSSVECVRKTSKWYKKIFFHLIDLSILNAFSAFKTVTGQNMPVANFQLEVIRQLLEKYGGNTVSPRGRPCTKDQPFRLSARHFPSDVKKLESGKVQRRKCIVCTRNNKRKDTMYMCQECDVGLCVTPCFAIYHTKQNYLDIQLF
ncbi:unnamed protein product [Macrosiphum euphorbiae]|uniref:PiggyBac transposable element-derived protein 4 n=2 Tax=Macrosiphum euphorbiae TaxID=13131 RepID=A0AAV0WBY7_9HEMI|nr:unnamed protein product [Macrosiphum euphorbiae]